MNALLDDSASPHGKEQVFEWTLISAISDEAVLNGSLLNSPDIASASEVLLQRDYASAAAAYNAGIDLAKTDVLVFAHQDVYFPPAWLQSLRQMSEWLDSNDPDWGVLGVWGATRTGNVGHVYCNGLMKELGGAFDTAEEVETLDEVVLILRKSSGLRFDESLPGFHMYGADICLEARRRRMRCYVISAFCIHNTNGYKLLPLQFWSCYLFMRFKWRSELPIITTCTRISFWCWPMIWWNIDRAASLILGNHKAGARVPDASVLLSKVTYEGGSL